MRENRFATVIVDAAHSLRLTNCRLKLLIDFKTELVKNGISRVVDNHPNPPFAP